MFDAALYSLTHSLINSINIYQTIRPLEDTWCLLATCSRSSMTSDTKSSGSSIPPSDVSRRTEVLIADQFSPPPACDTVQ